MRPAAGILVSFLLLDSAFAQERLSAVSNSADLGACLVPVETFEYKLEKTDPLYQDALQDHQRYLEELEDYVNCLDRERSQALQDLRASFDLFIANYGNDAVLRYAAEKQARDE